MANEECGMADGDIEAAVARTPVETATARRVRIWHVDPVTFAMKLVTVRTFRSVAAARGYLAAAWRTYKILDFDEVPEGADVASAQAVRQGWQE